MSLFNLDKQDVMDTCTQILEWTKADTTAKLEAAIQRVMNTPVKERWWRRTLTYPTREQAIEQLKYRDRFDWYSDYEVITTRWGSVRQVAQKLLNACAEDIYEESVALSIDHADFIHNWKNKMEEEPA